jgi:type IV pilus assembly protein PilB
MRIECANPNCDNIAHPVKEKFGLSESGLKKRDRWFCSRKCYIDTRADVFIDAKKDGIKRTVRRVKIGLLLLKNNLIDKDTLGTALEEQQRSGKRLGELLVETGKITRKELKSVLSMQAGVAPVSLDPHLTVKLKDVISFKIVREFRFVCFKFDEQEKVISVALYDLELLSCLEEIFEDIYHGYLVKFYLDDKEKILTILHNNYPPELWPHASTHLNGREDVHQETLVYKMVGFLTAGGAEEVKIGHLEGKVRITSKIEGLNVEIEISR